MLLFAQILLIWFTLHQQCFACYEEENTEFVSFDRQYQYRNYGNYDESRGRNVTKNSTITCSNVYSIAQITYPYENQDYEQFLIITNSNISTIHSMELHKFATITQLHLSHLHIHTIQPGAFIGLTTLKELHLDNNALTEVSNGVYNTLHRLEIFNLTNNQILRIENVAIVGLTALTHLHLRNNNLSKIENGFFETLNHLGFVDLSENPIEEFPFGEIRNVDTLLLTGSQISGLYSDLSNLTMRKLDLSRCQISEVDFAVFPKTNELDLSDNQILSVDNCQVLDTLSLDLDNNRIKILNENFVGVSKLYLGHNQFQALSKSVLGKSNLVLVLELGYNQLSTFDKNFFRGFTSLEILKLQHNGITKIDPILFKDLTRLTILDLSENHIDSFQFGVFDSLTSLKVLNISGNQLFDLHQYTFNSLSNLQSLHFDNNKISAFDVKDLGIHLPKLRQVSLDHNPWNCKELVAVEKYFFEIGVIIVAGDSFDVENFHGIACSNPKEVSISSKNFSFDEVSKNMQKAIGDGIRGSKMSNFFNAEFDNSKFAQFFDKSYIQSNFFKYLNNLKFVVSQQDLNGTKTEKFTALQTSPEDNSNKLLVFSVIIQVITSSLLLFIVYLLFTFIRKYKFVDKRKLSSEIELC